MRPLVSTILVILAAATVSLPAAAQQPRGASRAEAAHQRLRGADTTTLFAIRTSDGSTFTGRVVEADGDTLRFAASVGALTLPMAVVQDATVIRPQDIRNGVYWFRNPNTTRLLFAPTGRMLEKGEGYFSDYFVFLPGVAVGVADRFTIGGGMSVIPGVGLGEQMFYLTPKVGLMSRPGLDLALGALIAGAGGTGGDGESFGIVYSVGTVGGEHGGVTGGVGFGYADDEMSRKPAIMIGADRRLTRRVGFVSENYVIPGVMDGALLSAGLRFFGEKMALDFGFFLATAEASYPFPTVSFVVNF